MAVKSFPAHGCFSLALKGNVLVLNMEGIWNAEIVADFEREFPAFLARHGNPSNWGALTDLRDWGGGTPEAMERIAGNMEWLHSLGMKASARIVSEKFFSAMIDKAVRMESPYALFANPEDGLAWLASRGFSPER